MTEGYFDIVGNGAINFNRLVTGLSPGTLYHWRARVNYDLVITPFQPNGPWFQIPINGWNEADLRTDDVPPSSCPADIAGGDGQVNVDDLLAVINGWGDCPRPCPPYCPADINDDCAVNVDDLLAVINGWGVCP